MLPDEIQAIISRTEYQFSEDDIPNPEIMLESYFNTFTPAMYWIRTHHTLPPKPLIHNPDICDNNGFRCIDDWIEYCDGDVPVSLRVNPEFKNKLGDTPAMS